MPASTKYLGLSASLVILAGYVAAQELAPARAPVDDSAIDYAWSEAWDDHLHSGDRVPFTPPPIEDIPVGECGAMVRDGKQAFLSPAVYARDY
ncbi:MAG: hypothetical protein AAFO72_09290, partial [Pseudomonadota bacterium]